MQKRSDYGFHHYFELCQFVYCLLSRSRKLSSLPPLNPWESYMDTERIVEFEKVSTDDFLQDHELGAVLRQRNTSEFKGLRNRCREFIDYLVYKVLSHPVFSLKFMQGLYCFCPELLLESDDHHVFSLFNKLLCVLERSGSVRFKSCC